MNSIWKKNQSVSDIARLHITHMCDNIESISVHARACKLVTIYRGEGKLRYTYFSENMTPKTSRERAIQAKGGRDRSESRLIKMALPQARGTCVRRHLVFDSCQRGRESRLRNGIDFS